MTTDEDRVFRGVWRECKSYSGMSGTEKFEGGREKALLTVLLIC